MTIYSISLIVVFFIATAIDLACGPEPDPYDYYVQYFHNDLQKDQGYFPFYYNGYTILNGYSADLLDKNKSYEKHTNATEWVEYLGEGVSQQDVYKVLYALNRPTDSIYFCKGQKLAKVLPDSLRSNSFIRGLKKNSAAMAYFLMAKQTEHLVSDNYLWDPVKSPNTDDDHAAATKYLKMAALTHDKFLKLRCYYQAQRLLHYGGFFKEAENVYDRGIYNYRSHSDVKNWALGFKAGEEYYLGHNVSAARLYAKEFMLCPERRIQAYYDFKRTKVSITRAIKSTKSDAEKAVLYGIEGFGQPRIDLRPLQNAYDADPQSQVIPVLLAREINKLEEQYLTPRAKGNKYYEDIGYMERSKVDSLRKHLVTHIPELKAFCNRLAREKKYPEPSLGYIASAYLSWMTNEPGEGLPIIDRIDNKHIRPKLYDEEQLVRLLLLGQTIKHLDDGSITKLLPSLQWLEKKVLQERARPYSEEDRWGNYDGRHYAASARDFYETVLAKVYLQQKDTAMAALCILKSERTLLASERFMDDPGLGFDMPDFWQTKLHSWQLNKILKWDNDRNKTAYMASLLSPVHERNRVKLWDYGQTKSGQWLTSSKVVFYNPLPAVYELLGTAYLREHRYNEAITALKKAGAKKLDHEAGVIADSPNQRADPFDDRLTEHPFWYNSSYNSKLVFAIKMAQLKAATQGRDKLKAARACYQMGNGCYNTSYYGNAWFYTSYAWASDDKTGNRKFYYDDDYMREHSAEKYFLAAEKLSSDPEFKARCIFMAAKCKQKQVPYPNDYDGYITDILNKFNKSTPADKSYAKAVINNPYFHVLLGEYSKTAFYKTAESECSIFRDFLAGRVEPGVKKRESR